MKHVGVLNNFINNKFIIDPKFRKRQTLEMKSRRVSLANKLRIEQIIGNNIPNTANIPSRRKMRNYMKNNWEDSYRNSNQDLSLATSKENLLIKDWIEYVNSTSKLDTSIINNEDLNPELKVIEKGIKEAQHDLKRIINGNYVMYQTDLFYILPKL